MHQFDLSKIKIEAFDGENALLFAETAPIVVTPSSTAKPAILQPTPDESGLRTCPKCEKTTFKIENGCNSCINPDCGYAKCDM